MSKSCEAARMATVLIPLPDTDFDTTEIAVPWKLLTEAGQQCIFATEKGATPACDPLLLTGVVFGKLGAAPEPKAFYAELVIQPAFLHPLSWRECSAAQFDALLLGGGHAPGMKQYLDSTEVFRLVREFVEAPQKPIAAICHGVIPMARTQLATGHSALHGMRTTCLPKYMERAAYFSTFWRHGKYYRTYLEYVEDEVRRALAAPTDFECGPKTLSKRGTASDDTAAFVVEDPAGRYLSGRWPGDAYLLSKRFLARL